MLISLSSHDPAPFRAAENNNSHDIDQGHKSHII